MILASSCLVSGVPAGNGEVVVDNLGLVKVGIIVFATHHYFGREPIVYVVGIGIIATPTGNDLQLVTNHARGNIKVGGKA